MAQPNLSKAIKELEKEVGFVIFKRTATGVKPTEEGAEFLYYAKNISNQLSAVKRISQRAGSDKLKYKISIPRGSYIADGFTSFVSELKPEKGMEITVNETNDLGTISNVVDHGYNIGIIRYQVINEDYYLTMLKNNHLSYETLWEFEYVLVMSKQHPLAEKPVITVEDLHEFVKITHGDIDIPHAKNIGSPRADGSRAEQKMIYVYERGSQFDLLANVPTTYMWVSPIPNSYLERNGLVQRACKAPDNYYRDVLIYRQDYQLGEYDKLFQKKIYESKVEVASAKYH